MQLTEESVLELLVFETFLQVVSTIIILHVHGLKTNEITFSLLEVIYFNVSVFNIETVKRIFSHQETTC